MNHKHCNNRYNRFVPPIFTRDESHLIRGVFSSLHDLQHYVLVPLNGDYAFVFTDDKDGVQIYYWSPTFLEWVAPHGTGGGSSDTPEEIKEKYESNPDTNAFTDADKLKLDNLPTDALKNVQSDWNEVNANSDAFIKNKPTVPTKVSQLENDSNYATNAEVNTAIDRHNTDSTAHTYILNAISDLENITSETQKDLAGVESLAMSLENQMYYMTNEIQMNTHNIGILQSTRLEASNILAGDNIDVSVQGKNVTISSTLDTTIFIVVAELPSVGLENKIYLLSKTDPITGNSLDEYIWVNGQWELIGHIPVDVDLSNYYTKDETYSKDEVYNKEESDELFTPRMRTIVLNDYPEVLGLTTTSAVLNWITTTFGNEPFGTLFIGNLSNVKDLPGSSFITGVFHYPETHDPPIFGNDGVGTPYYWDGDKNLWVRFIGRQGTGDKSEIFNSNNNTASGSYSHAEGFASSATGNSSHCEGELCKASGWTSHAEGQMTLATGQDAHSEGTVTIASGSSAHAEGGYTKAAKTVTHAEGYYTLADEECAHAEGDHTEATGKASHAEGERSKAAGRASHAEGTTTLAFGMNSHAEGFEAQAVSDNSHAEGMLTIANNTGAHAEGKLTTAVGGLAHAEGLSTRASGDLSHAEGNETTASGPNSHAEGWATEASGDSSHAEGLGTKATNDYSHAEGHATVAWGGSAHAEGYATYATGEASHAEGHETGASGSWSHAEGHSTSAEGACAHAEGLSTIASGQYAHASGYYTVAANLYEFVTGAFNSSYIDLVFSIGIGTSETQRKNAFGVLRNGDIYIQYNNVYTRLQDLLGGGGGAVSSVNGKTGDVVLNAEDVGATTQAYVDSIVGDINSILDNINGLII